MGKFDRYMLSQLMVLFGFFSLVLVLVYWVNRAVKLFDQLIADGQSARVFLEFTALTLPGVISMVLPISTFAAAVYTTNRLASESELVVIQATGFSPFRLARPVVAFGIIVALLLSVLTHFLVPTSRAELKIRRAEIAENVTARLLREGEILHPSKGLTFYIREISDRGQLLDVFVSDSRTDGQRTNYSANSAIIIKSDNGPTLILFDGMAQRLRLSDDSLSITTFADISFEISSLINTKLSGKVHPDHRATSDLLWPTPKIVKNTSGSKARLISIGHERFALASLSLVCALVGFSTLLVGGFSRFGLWRQITAAIVILILLKSLDNVMVNQARSSTALWPLVYVSSIVGLCISYVALWISARPALFKRRPKVSA